MKIGGGNRVKGAVGSQGGSRVGSFIISFLKKKNVWTSMD